MISNYVTYHASLARRDDLARQTPNGRTSAEAKHATGLKRACEQGFCRFRHGRPVCLRIAASRRLG
jgi:hypothetical protein